MKSCIIQTSSKFNQTYEIDGKNDSYYYKVSYKNISHKIKFYKHGITQYTLKPYFSLAFKRNGVVNCFNIYNSDMEEIGYICYKKPYIKPHGYYMLMLYDVQYRMYEISEGYLGIKLPIYRYMHKEQIALIEKDFLVYNRLDAYSCIYKESYYSIVTALFGVYYDILRYRKYESNFIKRHKKYKPDITKTYDSLNLYDKSFKASISEEDE